MKHTYRIKEIADLLGLSIDAVRFYEKKGLVHPQVNPDNQYREYTMNNVLELLDVIYYRSLDLSIQEISEIFQTGTKERLQSLLEEKRKECMRRIRYEKQLLKKIRFMEDLILKIDALDCISIVEFPETYALVVRDDAEGMLADELTRLSKDEFVLSSIYMGYNHQKDEFLQTYITLEKDVLHDLGLKAGKEQRLQVAACIHRMIQMRGTSVTKGDVQAMLEFAHQHHLLVSNVLYIREIPLTSYMDEANYYAELYLPIIS